eukprot:TRINITY_DN9660_c0_g1_i1.p1 TRINITY_DN9660_c0_g1~~TRINITY_DN9660_c0_g1_i1.p1  ORF type:complete len:121 (+),score=49.86 TRINITY_DN9660_c0_g1_i1:243-605(+)
MAQVGTYVRVLDNSGAKIAKCIHVYRKQVATVGDKILVTVKQATPNKKAQKGQLYKAIVVRSKDPFHIEGGHQGRWDSGGVALLKTEDSDLMGTRIHGPVSSVFINTGWIKILTLAPFVY